MPVIYCHDLRIVVSILATLHRTVVYKRNKTCNLEVANRKACVKPTKTYANVEKTGLHLTLRTTNDVRRTK